MKFKYLWLFLLSLGFALLAGCGGGGDSAGSGGNPGGGTSNVAVFATDSLETEFDHVWVKVYSIALVNPNNTVQVFEDPAGRVIDLKTLRDAQGERFVFLDSVNIAPGAYQSARIVVDRGLTLVSRGQTQGVVRQFSDQYNIAGQTGRSQLEVRFAPAINIGTVRNLIIDFDLKNWDVMPNGQVSAVVIRGSENGLNDRRRHENSRFDGVVSNLSGTAPNQTFTLTGRGNRSTSIQVRTDANTAIFNDNGTPNPVLSNGVRVRVEGAFVNNVFMARTVKVKNNEDDVNEREIKGTFTNVNANAGTFTMTIRRARNFVPDRATVVVTTTATTRYFSNAGVAMTKEAFFAALLSAPAGSQVEAEGTLQGNNFIATKLKLDIENEANEAEVRGPVSNVNRAANTFTITATRWEGVNLTNNQQIAVTTTQATEFRIRNNNVSRQEFFNQLQNGRIVEVKGSFNGTTFTATRVKFEND